MRPPDSELALRVWDPFVRVFHWSLVSCVILNFFVVDDGETLHQLIGYLAATRFSRSFLAQQIRRGSASLPREAGPRQGEARWGRSGGRSADCDEYLLRHSAPG